MARIGLDPEGKVVNEVFALIYAPGRSRDRFPENCVTVMESEAAVLEGSDPEKESLSRPGHRALALFRRFPPLLSGVLAGRRRRMIFPA
jgi:hypothetical protein